MSYFNVLFLMLPPDFWSPVCITLLVSAEVSSEQLILLLCFFTYSAIAEGRRGIP